MLSSSSSLFDSLPTRPPTPPLKISEAIEDAISFLDDSNEVDRATSKSYSDDQRHDRASEPTPSSSQESTRTADAGKRVDFSPWPIYYNIAGLGLSSSPSAQLAKRSPLIKTAKPLKSILKLSDLPPPTPEDLDSKLSYFSPEVPGSFPKMLQSVVRQLASTSQLSRLDAYLALNGALKAYEDLPDVPTMVQKMDVFMQFLTRDMAWKDAEGRLDTNVINQALKLTCAILSRPRLSEALDDDFRAFLIERSIAVLEQAEMPKAIVKTHMHVLSQQRFNSLIMTPSRADKTITALQTIEDRCSGNSIIGMRLAIYLRLLERAPAVMLIRARDWLELIFHGMLSSVKDIRSRAIETCTQAGLVFGVQPHGCKALYELFEFEVEEGQSYCDYLCIRLIQMISEKENGAYVPQIWCAVIIFFRNRKKPLEKWLKFKSWISVMQKCLNSGDLSVRYQAFLAWNKLVFVTMPDSSTSKAMMSMLKSPLCSGMDKRGLDRYSKHVRWYALDSYYLLLHYAFRPGLTYEEYDSAWDTFLDPVASPMLKSGRTGHHTVCQILSGICTSSKGVWNVNAALESVPVKPEELPKLEPRWVRSRLGRILALLEPAIGKSMWSSPEANISLGSAWHSLMQSVADAGSQEVKTSNELKEAIALLIGLLRRVWNAYTVPPAGTVESVWLKRYVSVLNTTISTLGPGPFTEDILLTTREDSIEIAPTPSHRPSKHHGKPQSPLVLLLGQFYRPPKGSADDEVYENSATDLLQRMVSSRTDSAARLGLLSRSLHTLSEAPLSDTSYVLVARLWNPFARNAIDALQLEASILVGQESQNIGRGLRSALDVLSMGADLHADAASMIELYDTILAVARTKAGDAGPVIALMEPFAKRLIESGPSTSLETRMGLASHLLDNSLWPKTRQSLDHARKALSGVGLAPHKATVYDPFDHVHILVAELLTSAYHKANDLDVRAIQCYFDSVIKFLEGSPISLLAIAIRKVQSGLASWVEDTGSKTSTDGYLMDAIPNLWKALIQLLGKLPTKDSALLGALEPLLVAAFSSPHRAIVNETIVFWNENFGVGETLEYSRKLENVLRARAIDAEIILPDFPESNGEQMATSLPDFFDSQSQVAIAPAVPKFAVSERRDLNKVPAPQPTSHSHYFTAQKSPAVQTSSVSSLAHKAARRSISSTPKARLRHDNSQIQFASIDSSPLQQVEESQLLTEHQKEVTARQHEDAQLFPNLSSSPMAQSTALQRAVPKRLNFTSDAGQQDDEAPGTPTGLPDANGLLSDDVPSSPTPSSGKNVSQGPLDGRDEQEKEVAEEDLPSSPPKEGDDEDGQRQESIKRQPAVGSDETTVDITHFAVSAAHVSTEKRDDEPGRELANADPEHEQIGDVASDFPFDSHLPTEQLLLEEQDAALAHKSVIGASESQEDINREGFLQDEPPQETQQSRVEVTILATSGNQADRTKEAEEDRVTRVEDSFIEPDAVSATAESPSNAEIQQDQRPTKKRRRPSSTSSTAKKRKQHSPVKRIIDTILGRSQEEDDDDIEEEIVVASSQPASSPASKNAQLATCSPSQLDTKSSGPSGEPTTVVEGKPKIVEPIRKRGRGRPRKSETPTPAQSESGPPKSLKRKASVLSNGSAPESQNSTTLVEDTPASNRARKQRQAQDAKLVSVSHSSDDVLSTSRSTMRRVSAVVLDSTSAATSNDQRKISIGKDAETAAVESAYDGSNAVTDRAIVTPRSILGRLRDALTDFRGMFLNSQEEREYDDVLFELRREVHDAARRARDE